MANTPNEVGGWVIDPKNPRRATYTDPDTGELYEAVKPMTQSEDVDASSGFVEKTPEEYQTASNRNEFSQEAERLGGLRASQETRDFLGGDGTPMSRIADGVSGILTGTMVGAGVAARGVDDLFDRTGLADLAPNGSKLHPGEMLMALAEAFPAGGAEVGLMGPAAANTAGKVAGVADEAGDLARLNAERTRYNADTAIRAKAQELFDSGTATRADFDKLTDEGGYPRYGPELDDALAHRDKSAKFTEVQTGEAKAKYTKLAEEENARASGEIFKAQVKNPDPVKSVEEGVAHVTDLTADWQNPPRIEIADDFANLADDALREALDPEAIGVTTPDGKVLINLKNVKKEADARGVTQNEVLSAVTYHEGLGHHGLTQEFGEALDDLLMDMYQGSKGNFGRDVDKWMEENPNAYIDDANPVARAVEEVLAEKSEAGVITSSQYARFRKALADRGRAMGLNLKYTDGEIDTILGMAHNATVSGVGRDVAANGFRYARAYHGSPHTFDEFSTDNGGTGAGFQLISDGVYLTSDAEYAKAYRLGPNGKTYEVEIPDKGWYDWDESIESQPEFKAALDRLGYKPFSKRQTAGDAYKDLEFEYGARQTSEMLHKEGIAGNRYKDFDGTVNYVAYNAKDAKIINRYMRRTRDAEKPEPRRVGGVNIDNITNVKDVDYILEQASKTELGESVPREVTARMARDLGLTPSKLLKPGMDEAGLAAKIEGGMQVMVNQLGKVQGILNKMSTASDAQAATLQLQFAKEIATLDTIRARVAGNNSEVGRALNILNKMRSANKTTDELFRLMRASGGKAANILGNPQNVQQLMHTMQMHALNPSAQVKLAQAALKPRAEDYIFRGWYNMMLSAPATHAANMLGTLGNFGVDLLENTGAAVIGQRGRLANADRVRGREVMYRVYGAVRALKDAKTWRETLESYKTGTTGNTVTSKVAGQSVYTGTNPHLKVGSYLAEGPTRALAAEDEWWRNILSASNMHGLAVRNAGNKGLKGQAFWDEVENLVQNPTNEMIEATNDYTKTMQFMDKPSKIAAGLNRLTSTETKTSIPGRIGSGAMKLVVPFVNTPDSLIRTTLRRTPLGVLERENVKGWAAGGAARDQTVARLTMGSLFGAWIAMKAVDGDITGAGPSDPRKRIEWEAANQPNSIKIGDTQYSINGLEPVSTNISAVATLVERMKAGEIAKDDIPGSVLAATTGLGKVLVDNSYMRSFTDLVAAFSGGPTAETKAAGIIGSILSTASTPAVLRTATQMRDPAARDTTGDGSVGDRITGRVKSGWPGSSEELPQRYDVFGREIVRDKAGPDALSRSLQRDKEDDPTIAELQRLINSDPESVVLGAPGKSVKVKGEERRLNAEEYQNYQRLSGYWITETVRNEMNSPEWKAMTDKEKIIELKDITKEMRKTAREYLFDPEDEEVEETE